MTTHDDDILDFDFFDEGETGESPPRQGHAPRRQPGGGGRRPPRLRSGWTPLIRLVGLVAFAILVLVLIVVAVQGCTERSKRDTYADYTEQIGEVGSDSQQRGKRLAELLTTPGLKQAELEQKLGGLIQDEQLGVTQAEQIDAPGALQSAHDAALEALRFRVSGMQGLLVVFRETKDRKDATAAGQALSVQGQRLITSDVIWNDLFRVPAKAQMVSVGVDDVAAPASVFVENPDLYSPRSMTAIWQRVHGASTGGTTTGLHGTGIAYVKALPSGTTLATTTEATIVATSDLAFEVGVTDTGDNQEVQVQVTLTIPKQPDNVVKRQTIDLIDPGETKSVTFGELGELPYGEQTTVKIDVKPVLGEKNTANNTAEYPVIFSIES